MKKDYNSKKKVTIAALSAVALCLAGGLFYYVGTLDNTTPPISAESTPPAQTEVVVPEITPESTDTPETSTAPESTPAEETTEAGSTTPTNGGEVEKPSDGKPKSPAQATPPAEKPKDTTSVAHVENPDKNGQCQPEHKPKPEPDQPQGGEKENGKIYVPGFGWIEDEGGGSNVIDGDFDITGEKVGDM